MVFRCLFWKSSTVFQSIYFLCQINGDSFHQKGGPSLYLTLINSFPDLKREDLLFQFNKAASVRVFLNNPKYSQGVSKTHKRCRWIMLKSDYAAVEMHNPVSQMDAFTNVGTLDRFSPYQQTSVSSKPSASITTPSVARHASRRPGTRQWGQHTIEDSASLEILALFAAWKNECASPANFIPQTSYEDLCLALPGRVSVQVDGSTLIVYS